MYARAHHIPLPAALALSLVLAVPVTAQTDAEPVPYLDDQGTQLGTILVREFMDPYTEFEPSSPPAEGQRYALLNLVLEAAEDQAFPTDPRQVQLQDSNGWVHQPGWFPRPADSVVPDLQSQTLAPFDRISGVVPFILPSEAEIVRVLYRGNGQRLMSILELGDLGAVAMGEAKPVSDAAGVPLGSLTVREVMDPFADFDPNGPPAEGHRYVMLDVAFEAAEDQAMLATPSSVYLVDDAGRMYWPTHVPRVPPYLLQYAEAQALSPSDRVSGLIGYSLPQDQVVTSIVYSPEGNRFLPLVDPQP